MCLIFILHKKLKNRVCAVVALKTAKARISECQIIRKKMDEKIVAIRIGRFFLKVKNGYVQTE